MKKKTFAIFLLFVMVISSCAPAGEAEPEVPIDSGEAAIQAEPPTDAAPTARPTPGKNIVVTSAEDDGPGSLRQAMESAGPGDVITFDAAVFPPAMPATIQLRSGLPALTAGGVTLDASGAGVFLDGSAAGSGWTPGFDIQSDGNTIMGFEIANFSGPGVLLGQGAERNRIGGDRQSGDGPTGQGNLIRNTSDGIALQDASGNIISGNIIGVEGAGNLAPGIFLDGNSSRNVIGPGNEIAFNGVNGGAGIEIRSPKAVGSRITANNIHDHPFGSIHFQREVISEELIPVPPHIMEFDLDLGAVSGAACPGCMVELFTSDEQGDLFVGVTQADFEGFFSIDNEGPIEGGGLKATAFAEGSNTSAYSSPESARSRALAFQKGASARPAPLPQITFDEMPFNRIGTMVRLDCREDDGSDAFFAQMAREWGYKWMRINVTWFDWPEVELTGGYTDFNVEACQDRAVDLLVENGIEPVYTITYWDPEIQVYEGYSRFRTQEEIDRYLEYVKFIVGHFKGRIRWYSILNEPNLSDGQRAVKVEDYINLVRQVIPVIREVDPQAKVAIAEVCPLNESGSLAYLNAIIASDVTAKADGLVWHGSSGNSLDYQPDYYRAYPGWVDGIVKDAKANGFKGVFFATELHWRTPESAQPIHGMPWFYSNTVAGKYYARGMTFNLSKGFWIVTGHEYYETIPEVVAVIQNLTRLLAGAEPAEIEAFFEPSSPDLRSAGFAMPDGRRMVAVWRDVIAVDADPGVETIITLPGLKAGKVTGMDPLYGYQQELIFEEGLTIPGVLVYDYPTFLMVEE